MAYADASFGFRPVMHKNGAPYNGAVTLYWVDSSDSTAIYPGDPVIIDGTSNTAEIKVAGGGTFPPGTLQGATRATAGATNRVTGVCTAVLAADDSSLVYRAASTERVIAVADDPDLLFEVQADAAVATASVGLNTNILFTHAGSTVTNTSGAEVDATAAADATYQATIHRFTNDPKNTANAAGNRVLVSFALHTNVAAGGMVGV